MTWPRLALLFFLAPLAWAQTALDMAAEPHHHLLLDNDQVRVFAVALKPTEQAYARHEHSFLMVTLVDSELVIWREGQSPIQHFRLPQGEARFVRSGHAIGLRNDRSSEYRGVIVEFLNPKVTTYGYHYDGDWDYADGPIAGPVDPHAKFSNGMRMGAASAVDVQLLAGDSFPPPEKESAELLIPVSDLDLKVQGDKLLHKSPGEIVWIPVPAPGRTSAFVNAATRPARFVDVELLTHPAN
jgi:hypothetical protein